MTRATASRGRDHFDRLYAKSDDPWHFRDSPYEHEKYAATLASLPRAHFCRGLEVGCSIGELTIRLADRCESMLAIDTAAAALSAARARCAASPHVQFAQMHVPHEWPAEPFDLIVLSEILYFLAQADIQTLAARVRGSLMPGGIVLLVNWLGPLDDPCGGQDAADHFIDCVPELKQLRKENGDKYRLDVLEKEELLF